MAEPMSVSMTIKIVDEASAGVRAVTAAYREMGTAGQEAARAVSGGTSDIDAQKGAIAGATAALKDEGAAVDGVTGKIGALRAATVEAAAPIGDAVGKLREEGRAVDEVAAKMRALGTAAGGAGGRGGGEPPGAPAGAYDWGDEAGRNKDWGAYWAAKREGESGEGKPRASDWVAQQQAVQAYGEEVSRTATKVEELEHGMARLGMAGMAFSQVRQAGEALQRPVEAVDDAYTDFQAKTQDLATRSGDNAGQKAIGDHILKVARDANVAWQQVYEGEQALASLGGGDQLKAMAQFETRMNQLALAGHVETRDIYGAMMHYIKGGLSAAEAMDALEQQHVQGKRGSYELQNMARGMPRLMALGREFGMTPKQAAVDTSAMLQIFRENTGSPEQADVLAQHVMTKLGDPRTMKRLQADLGVDGFADREQAQKEGVNPLFHLLNTIAEKFAHLSEDQKGKVVPDADGHGGAVEGGDPRIMGDLARDYYFRAALDAYMQHRAELSKYDVPIDEARKTTDQDYAAQNDTVKQAKQAAANRAAEAQLRTGETQVPVMKAVAGAQGAAADVAGKVAGDHPVATEVGTAVTGFVGTAMKTLGQIGEAAIAGLTAFKALQWVGAKVPGAATVADAVKDAATAANDPVGAVKGAVDGARQAQAEARAAPATESVADAMRSAAGAAIEFAEASRSLGTVGMMAALASRRDIGLGRDLSSESLAQNPLGIHLPGDPEVPVAPAPEGPGLATRVSDAIKSGFMALVASVASTDAPPVAAAAPPPVAAQIAPSATAVPAELMRGVIDPLGAAVTSAIAKATTATATPPAPKPTAAAELPQNVTNNNQKTVNAPITVNAPVTINATMNNTTPAAVGAAVGAGVQGGVRAGAGALHDGSETK